MKTVVAEAVISTNRSNTQPRNNLQWRRTIRIIIITYLTSVIFGLACFFTIWFGITPSVPRFQLDSASISSFNVSTPELIVGNWNLGFTVRKPNKKWNANYDRFIGYMNYGREEPVATLLLLFNQGKRIQTTIRLRLNFAVRNDVAKSLAVDRRRGAVNFNVKLKSLVTSKIGKWAWRSEGESMSVYCDNIRVSFSSNSGVGSLSDGSTGCDSSLMRSYSLHPQI